MPAKQMSLAITPTSAPSFMKRMSFVVRAWWKHPTDVATICPSSSFLTQNLASRECVRNASTLIELGPGAGGTTAAILKQMRPDSRLLAIEKMPEFREALSEIVDPRFNSEIGDAVDLLEILKNHGCGRPDVVISGIPFSALESPVAQEIVFAIHAALQPGGAFVAYQVRSDILQYARPWFGPAKCCDVIALNLPPLKVFEWRKEC